MDCKNMQETVIQQTNGQHALRVKKAHVCIQSMKPILKKKQTAKLLYTQLSFFQYLKGSKFCGYSILRILAETAKCFPLRYSVCHAKCIQVLQF